MPSAFTHGLLPAACAFSTAKGLLPLDAKQGRRFLLACFILGNAPDLDLIPAALFPAYYEQLHRELGHNAIALAVWISLGAMALRNWVSPAFAGRRGWIFSALLVLSHVLLDSCAEAAPGSRVHPGVPILWPFSNWELVTPIPLFGGYHIAHGVHPLLGHLLSPEFWWTFLTREVLVTAAGAAGWYTLLKLLTATSRGRKPALTP